jgi:hypothetical protein
MKSVWLLSLLAASAGLLPAQPAAATTRPNIVFILADDLGWSDLGCYGSTFYETPHLDRLAAAGVRFTQAYAASNVCSPTRASILTGRYPARIGITDWLPGRKSRPEDRLLSPALPSHLAVGETTFAETLRAAGYRTGFIGKWHLGEEPAHLPEAQGFDLNIGGSGKGHPPSYFSPYRLPNLPDGPPGEHLDDRLTREAEAFISQAAAERRRFLHWLSVTRGFRYACLRYFNAAGATATHGEDHNPELHLIPLVLQVALGRRESIAVFGTDYPTPDGTCIRDYIHVEDLIDAHLLALRALEHGNCVYNLGNGSGFSVRQVISAAEAVTGRKIPVVVAPRRAGDPAVLVAASNRIQADLGWKPRHPDIVQIVRSAWSWHQRHPQGYNDR